MKKVYLNIIRANTSPVSIGMLSQTNETFYGEFSEFCETLPEGITCKMSEPSPGEMEPWVWSSKNDVEMRGDKEELAKNIKDWFHAILGGALSWVDYSEEMGGPGFRNIAPIIDNPQIEIRTMSQDEWNIFIDMFDDFPKCLVDTPVYLGTVVNQIGSDIPDLDKFRTLYHTGSSKFNPIDNCRVWISYISTAERVKESQK